MQAKRTSSDWIARKSHDKLGLSAIIISRRTNFPPSCPIPIPSTMNTSTPQPIEYEHDLHQSKVAYHPRKGLGIQVCPDPLHNVYTNSLGDAARFNEPKNAYGLFLLSKCLEAHRQRFLEAKTAKTANDKIPTGEERMILDATFKNESIRLTQAAGFQSEAFNTKHRNYLHTIMRDFNKEITNTIGNVSLERIALRYFQIRMGFDPYDLDEFEAAMKAVQLDYVSRPATTMYEGQGPWTLPIVHLLNGHLVQRNFPPIAFRITYEDDQKYSVPFRKEHSRKTYIDDTECQVETRDELREKMLEVLGEHNDEQGEAPVETDVPPVVAEPQTPVATPKRLVTLQSKSHSKRARHA